MLSEKKETQIDISPHAHRQIAYYTDQLVACRRLWARSSSPQRRNAVEKNMAYNEGFLRCQGCQTEVGGDRSEPTYRPYEVDHVDPIGGNLCFNFDELLQKLRKLDSVNVQILCYACHDEKTKEDRKLSRLETTRKFQPRLLHMAEKVGLARKPSDCRICLNKTEMLSLEKKYLKIKFCEKQSLEGFKTAIGKFFKKKLTTNKK